MEKISLSAISKKLKNHLGNLEYVISHLKTDVRQKDNWASILIYCSIYEQSYACLKLLNPHGFNSLPIILRAMFEAQVDLGNLLDDNKGEKHVDVLHAKYIEQKKKFLKNRVQRMEGERTEEEKRIEDDYIEAKEELKSLKKEGVEPISISQKFSDVGLEEAYENQYAALCLDTHNDISILEKKHFTQYDESFEFEIFKKRPQEDIKVFVNMLIGSLIASTETILGKLEIEKNDQIEGILDNLKGMQSLIWKSEIVYE